MPCRKSLHGLCCCAWLFLVQGSARLKSIRHIHEHNLVTYRSSVHIQHPVHLDVLTIAAHRESIHCARWCDASRRESIRSIGVTHLASFAIWLCYIYIVSQIELETSLHRGVGRCAAAYCKSYFASTLYSRQYLHDSNQYTSAAVHSLTLCMTWIG